ncbi:SP_0009 family protein [Streptococcus respiraculi]|nr:SP_0009 family protein [Streptococcus respiraculi]
MTETIVEIVEKFLAYSDEKLEELAEKNQALKTEEKDTKK